MVIAGQACPDLCRESPDEKCPAVVPLRLEMVLTASRRGDYSRLASCQFQ
jgi:hypothetical protein